MMPPRGLSLGEAALWRQVAATVTPLGGVRLPLVQSLSSPLPHAGGVGGGAVAAPPLVKQAKPTPNPSRIREGDLTRHGLDASWERKLAKAQVAPDLTIDLHGLGLDAAYTRLGAALGQAVAMQARLVLVIAGKSRPHGDHGVDDQAGRGNRRGAIRAKLVDWLAASPHASRIAAVRPAAQRHGGAGAVYVVLRKSRAL